MCIFENTFFRKKCNFGDALSKTFFLEKECLRRCILENFHLFLEKDNTINSKKGHELQCDPMDLTTKEQEKLRDL